MKANILIIDDESSIRDFLKNFLEKNKYTVNTASNGEEGLKIFSQDLYHVVITDLKMPPPDGMEVLRIVKETSPQTAVIMMTAHGNTENAVEAMKLGAEDYIQKPFKLEEFKILLEKALEKKSLLTENELLKNEIKHKISSHQILGTSTEINKIQEMVKEIGPLNTTVLITGESGTGKEIIARNIHQFSANPNAPFVAINCAALPENLLESELFGYKKGAFTGATHDKEGLFISAKNGTIFLDEIGEMPLSLQSKLLRVLQERVIRPIGALKDLPIEARVISATNQLLPDLVKNHLFREDLYFRLNVIEITLPPLRKRREDLSGLLGYFTEFYSKKFSKPIKKIDPSILKIIENYDFPGNIRELENLTERAVALEKTDVLTSEHFRSLNTKGDAHTNEIQIPTNLDEVSAQFEIQYIKKSLEMSNGNKTEAAKLLGISFRSFRYRCEKYKIDI